MKQERNILIALKLTVVTAFALVILIGCAGTVQMGYEESAAELTVAAGTQYVVTETEELGSLTIESGAEVTAADGSLLSLIVNGVEVPLAEGTYTGDVVLALTEDYSDTVMGSFSQRGGEEFRAGIYIDGNGLNEDRSVFQAVSGGTVDAASADGISITSESDNFNAIILDGGEYTISDADISLAGKSDGSNTNDFSGLGSLVAAYKDAKVTVSESTLYTEGVARPVMFTDDGSDSLITDSKITSMGGTLYDGYVNTADQTKMVAPPWVLGITGNARTTNLMGECSTATVVRTDAYANQWGVLSTDSGSDMVLTVVDSTLTLLGEGQNDPFSENYGSGYGTYIIGDAQEYFYGVTFNVGTYASILTGGYGRYASSDFDAPIDIYPLKHIPNGTTQVDFMGNEFEGYDVVSEDAPVFTGITGEGKITTINSDAFGFMAHNNGTLEITDGTVMNTDNAAFLLKSGDVNIIVSDSAVINAEDGVLLQMIDNDDSIVGADFSQGAPNFNTDFYEAEGFPGIDYEVASPAPAGGEGPGGPPMMMGGANTVTFTATDVTLHGDLYNGTGYYGGQSSDLLKINLGSGCTLTGDIAATTIQHVDENGVQNTHFTIDEYYYLGHVANREFYNGENDVEVTLTDGAVWYVADSSLITKLVIDDSSNVAASNGKTLRMYVDGRLTPIAAGTYQGSISLQAK